MSRYFAVNDVLPGNRLHDSLANQTLREDSKHHDALTHLSFKFNPVLLGIYLEKKISDMSYKSHDNATKSNAQGFSDYEEISNVQPSSSAVLGFGSAVQLPSGSSPRTSKKKASFLGSLSKGTIRKGTFITKPRHQGFLSEEPFEVRTFACISDHGVNIPTISLFFFSSTV